MPVTCSSTSAEKTSSLPIPLIDFSQFPAESSSNPVANLTNSKQRTAEEVLSAFSHRGFLYLKSHGISPDILSKVFRHSEEFFARPVNDKKQVAWTTPQANRGWSAPGREKLALQRASPSEAAPEDLKESFEIGREGVEGFPNRWPGSSDGTLSSSVMEHVEPKVAKTDGEFKETMLEFYQQCRDLFARVMRAVALGLGLEEQWFDDFLQKGDCTLRLLFYPGDEGGEQGLNNGDDTEGAWEKAKLRAAAHTDYGAITLLFQDANPGLQVLSPSGTFVDAPPIPGAVIVNAGDLLARWSNDTIKSTVHRVVATRPSGTTTGPNDGLAAKAQLRPARYSIAFFCNPDFDRWIEAIPGTYDGEQVERGRPRRYEGIYSGEYLKQRLSVTY